MASIKPGDEIHVVLDAIDGTIVAMNVAGDWMPMICTTERVKPMMLATAQIMSTQKKRHLILRRFVRTADSDTQINPE